MAEARAQMEVNVFGAARLIQLVLPAMRAQHSGTIVNVTSMGGKITTPLGAWYHATKFALEAISDCLRMEVAPFGIDVVVIDPGGIRTEWGGIAAEKVRAVSSRGPYAAQGNAVANSLTSETTRRRSSPPELIGTTITKAVTTRRPKTRYAAGYGARPMIVLHGLLPTAPSMRSYAGPPASHPPEHRPVTAVATPVHPADNTLRASRRHQHPAAIQPRRFP